ncbi:uncharacterized protein K02A2.6-like [Amborella trichopoda]|uniref:uncharacterized protein K02A2.6-like n=1 Tax=Amborella trichopoda TaxID=13333 RepID=UPI0005D3AB36|nr:uncharacterized protein K02A2.6-like [Amborella trichopoda]|eukprot:XP_011625568.1 uncharacterized protein K02A2.6-like [Amborella trichopoda]
MTSWPVSQWGMDIIGVINLPSVLGHAFILAAIGYFSKWAEVIPLKQVTGTAVANFMRHHTIYRFGVLDWIISENGPQFRIHHVDHLVNQFSFEWKYSAMYYPQANKLAEEFNKTLCGEL